MTLNDRINALNLSPNTIVNNYITQVINTGSILSEDIVSPQENLPIYTLLNGSNNKTIDSISEMNEEKITLLDTSRNAIDYITKLLTESIHIIRDFVSLRVTALQGYFDEIWTNKINTIELNASGASIDKIQTKDIHMERLCIKKTNGTEICLNGNQLETLMGGTSTQPVISTPIDNSSVSPISETSSNSNSGVISTESGSSSESSSSIIEASENTNSGIEDTVASPVSTTEIESAKTVIPAPDTSTTNSIPEITPSIDAGSNNI